MRVAVIGGGPAGLYFPSCLRKRGPTRSSQFSTIFQRSPPFCSHCQGPNAILVSLELTGQGAP